MATGFMKVSILAASILATGAASAGPRHEDHYRDHDRGHHGEHQRERGRYVWVRVVDVDPIVRVDRVRNPVERCVAPRSGAPARWRGDDRRHVERDRRVDPAAVLLGGAIGGAVGSQLGHGDGRPVATVVGAVIGASIGAQASLHGGDYRPRPVAWRAGPPPRCEVRYETHRVERVTGYRVTYRHHGRTFTDVVDERPGRRMRVRMDLRPV